eukprot:CAMPEP_0119065836 /NCGR_PEP_ID=MMETSP1178-20130426/8558_1 /TAXON_ID=33656 /ORGANISM="unid sp, Strain CCMP2000" /LENGTH=57 /DNA_ID=CAMNT_0007047389 /DNA_START=195 /DNA_END=368 /DNA_ORIENTATION=-
MTSVPASMRACLRVAASSIFILGIPVPTARAIPPRASTSSMIASACSTNWLVRLSIM